MSMLQFKIKFSLKFFLPGLILNFHLLKALICELLEVGDK